MSGISALKLSKILAYITIIILITAIVVCGFHHR